MMIKNLFCLFQLQLITIKVIDDRPIIVFSFNTQQISVIKDGKGNILDGDENQIDNINYVVAFGIEEDAHKSKITGGWKLVEMAIRDKNGSW
jgi:hypothetical protein